MKYIELGINLTDDLGIASVIINQNDTNLPSDSNLINRVAFTLLKSMHLNKENIDLQDFLNELDITLSKK